MGRWHITDELLRALERREVDPATYLMLLVEHLVDLCPECAAGLRSFVVEDALAVAGQTSSRPTGGESLIGPGSEPEGPPRHHHARTQAGSAVPEAVLAEILAVEDAAQRRRWLEARVERVASPELASLLIDTSYARTRDQAAEARELAELAERVAVALAPRAPAASRRLAISAKAHRANALRVAGELKSANDLMSEAIAATEGEGGQLRAEVLDLAASLAKDQRRWSDAEALLETAIEQYGEIGCFTELARALVNRAEVASLSGKPAEALEVLERALDHVDAASDPYTHLCAHHNRALYLCELGEYEAAGELIEANADLYRRSRSRTVELRLGWVEGKVARGLGEMERAVERFRAVRDGFLDVGRGYDAALVTLDLAALYLEEGQHDEVRRLATWMVVLFEAEDIHREAMASLMLLAQAAERDALTVAELRRVTRYLHQVRTGAPSMAEPAS